MTSQNYVDQQYAHFQRFLKADDPHTKGMARKALENLAQEFPAEVSVAAVAWHQPTRPAARPAKPTAAAAPAAATARPARISRADDIYTRSRRTTTRQ